MAPTSHPGVSHAAVAVAYIVIVVAGSEGHRG
jgi:hypothetical protein